MARKAKKEKIDNRTRARYRVRKKISGTDERPRISVFRSSRNMYAQVISDTSGKTLASASTLEQEVQDALGSSSGEEGASSSTSKKSVAAAKALGLVLGKRCQAQSISSVVFDRNGMFYHGRVKAVADGAREAGLKF